MRALITGITGFAGSHLAEHILAEHPGVEVFGTFRWRSRMDNVEHLDKKIHLVEADLRDYTSMHHALEVTRPDYIFHLAAQSFVPSSWNAPNDTIVTNATGQTNLFEAVRALKLDPVIQIACSSEQYGLVLPDEVPIKETNPLRPLSPYAVSKVAQDYFGYQYFQSYGMRIIRTRGFNHTGPRRGHVFVTSNFCSQVAAIELGLQEPVIRVGNLDAIRDMLDLVLSFSTVEVRTEVDPDRLRPSDVEILIGDSSKFRAATGWEPLIPFEQTVRDLLDYWRERLALRKRT